MAALHRFKTLQVLIALFVLSVAIETITSDAGAAADNKATADAKVSGEEKNEKDMLPDSEGLIAAALNGRGPTPTC